MRRGLQNVLGVVAFSLLAWLGNRFSEPLALGIDLTFGSIASLLALLTVGPIGGMIAAVVGSLAKALAWDMPFYTAVSILEVIVVGFAIRRVWNQLIVASAFFWILIASVLAWAYFYIHVEASYETTLFVWLKYSINGIFNALIASLLLLTWDLISFARGRSSKRSFDSILFNALAASVFIPMFIIIIASSREKYRGYEMEARAKVSDVSQTIDLFLKNFRNRRASLVRNLGEMVPLDEPLDAAEIDRILAIAHRAFPNFEELLVIGRQGQVRGSLSALSERELSTAPELVDIRELLSATDLVEGLSGVLPQFMGREGSFIIFFHAISGEPDTRGYILGSVRRTCES